MRPYLCVGDQAKGVITAYWFSSRSTAKNGCRLLQKLRYDRAGHPLCRRMTCRQRQSGRECHAADSDSGLKAGREWKTRFTTKISSRTRRVIFILVLSVRFVRQIPFYQTYGDYGAARYGESLQAERARDELPQSHRTDNYDCRTEILCRKKRRLCRKAAHVGAAGGLRPGYLVEVHSAAWRERYTAHGIYTVAGRSHDTGRSGEIGTHRLSVKRTLPSDWW